MSKFKTPHAEVRLFLPMDSEELIEFKETKAYQHLLQAYLLLTNSSKKDADKREEEKKGEKKP